MRYEDRNRYYEEFVSLDQLIAENVIRDCRKKYLYSRTGSSESVSWNNQAQAVPAANNTEELYNSLFGKEDLNVVRSKIQRRRHAPAHGGTVVTVSRRWESPAR